MNPESGQKTRGGLEVQFEAITGKICLNRDKDGKGCTYFCVRGKVVC